MRTRQTRRFAGRLLLGFGMSMLPSLAVAQDTGSSMQMTMKMPAGGSWMFMQDGIVFAEFNHQGGARGGDEIIAPNWWMGMASRTTTHGQVTFDGMFSLEPATVGESGYREIFQTGEALNGRPLIDRQHPHDLFMQLAAIWRLSIGDATGFTLAGGPVGEPALGPVAFMHRASAADNPTVPLTHHSFDSTHISFGVVTAAVDHGPIVVEGSVFNGREPDQNRWDFDFGPLDSVSGRIWYRPNQEWEFQASSGRLTHPEQLDPTNIVRSTVSAAWTRQSGETIASVSVGYASNDADEGTRNAFFAEAARHADLNTVYTRVEALQVETGLLQTGAILSGPAANVKDPVLAFTIGGARDVLRWEGFEGGFGGDVTFYGVPGSLQPMYSAHPISFHVFFRLRPPSGAMGRMWNMRMSQPMAGHTMAMR